MSLPIPIPTVETGPAYATDINTCLTTIDQHDHSTGKGTQVTPAGLNISADLAFGSNNATTLRSVRFTSQSGVLSGVNDLGCLYENGVNLYYNDGNGNQIPLTSNGSIAASAGSIGNLISPANVTYNSGLSTYVFQSTSATPGNLDGGSITIRKVTASSPGITISAPSNLTSNYTITASSATPASSAYVVMNNAGNLSYATPAHITLWKPYTLTIHAVTTDPTPPGSAISQANYRQVGDTMEINYTYNGCGSGGSNGSGVYIFPLPSSTLIDSTKIAINASQNGQNNAAGLGGAGLCGTAWLVNGSITGPGFMSVYNSTGLVMGVFSTFNNSIGLAGDALSGLSATSAIFSFTAKVPIVGWS